MFFNVYALAASCVAVALLNFASAFDAGISKATLSLLLLLFFYKLDISPASRRRDYLYLKDCIDPYIAKMTPRSFYRCLDQIKSGASAPPHLSLRQFVARTNSINLVA